MTAPAVFLNRIATAVPKHQVHQLFIDYVSGVLPEREARIFSRLARKAHIDCRYSVLPEPNVEQRHRGWLDGFEFYPKKGKFPSTGRRMQVFAETAWPLAERALQELLETERRSRVTHVLVTCCTGFFAPGLDLQIQRVLGLSSQVERQIIGFMGCFAGINALREARHIVRSQPEAVVLILNLELCTLHFQEQASLEEFLGALQFADGCAASLVSAEARGLELLSFSSDLSADHQELIQWHITDQGFRMHLDPRVPQAVAEVLPNLRSRFHALGEPSLWAVHPGGHSILDAVESSLQLDPAALAPSREILRQFGNMSSATIMFVLKQLTAAESGQLGCGLAFGPGLSVESMLFRTATWGK